MPTDNQSAKDLVARYFATFSTGNVSGLLSMMTDDSVWWVSGSVDGFSGSYGKQQFGQLLAGVAGVYKTGALQITPHAMIAEDGKVAVEAQAYGELKNGRVYQSKYHFLVETRDGKISAVREYMDTLHAKQVFFEP
ncbi:MAG: nuclear transport factor 2 family protein [Caulobacterales bacterium]